MKAFFAFGLLILIALLGSRFLFKRKKVFNPLYYFILSGLLYIFFGVFLGRHYLNVLSLEVLKGLYPLISFGLGWIGFLFGFQLEIKYLRRFSRKFITLSFLQFLLVLLIVSISLSFVLRLFFSSQPLFILNGMAVALGLLSSLSSPTLLNYASTRIPKKGNCFYLARFLVSVSGFWGIIGLAVISSFWHFPLSDKIVIVNSFILFLSLILFAVLLGFVFHFLTIKKISDQNLFVILLSLVFFASGAALYFNLPPLCVCMISGIVFSNLTRNHEKIYPLFLASEKPFYIIFLILIGALWELHFDYRTAILVGLLLFLRPLGFSLPLRPFGGFLRFPFSLPSRLGLCFLSPGGIAVAFAVSLELMYALPLIDEFVSVALIMIVITEFISPWTVKQSLYVLESEG